MTVNPNYNPAKANWRFKDEIGFEVVDGVVR
jgi:hypothetical protein